MKTISSATKMLIKNIDLDNQTVLVLQMEATRAGYGTLKPFLEQILKDRAARVEKEYVKFLNNVSMQGKKLKGKKLFKG